MQEGQKIHASVHLCRGKYHEYTPKARFHDSETSWETVKEITDWTESDPYADIPEMWTRFKGEYKLSSIGPESDVTALENLVKFGVAGDSINRLDDAPEGLAKWFWKHFPTDIRAEERKIFTTFFKVLTAVPLPEGSMAAWFSQYMGTLDTSSFEYGLQLLEFAIKETVHLAKLAESSCIDILLTAFEKWFHQPPSEFHKTSADYARIFSILMKALDGAIASCGNSDIKCRRIDRLRMISLKSPHSGLPPTAPHRLRLLIFELELETSDWGTTRS